MTVKVSDLMDESSTETTDDTNESERSPDSDVLEGICDEIGADYDHAMLYVDEHGNKDELIEYAEKLRENPEHADVMESYREWNDQHRIRSRWLYNVDGDFSKWSGAFYGNSDDPDPGTYNAVQQEARDAGGNLIFYKALFPEPQEQYWDEEVVLYWEAPEIGYDDDDRDVQDAHIYVPRSFVDEYSSYTMDVDGQTLPRPPTNEELGGAPSSSTKSTSDKGNDDPDEGFECRNPGCDRVFESKQGRAPHENRWCDHKDEERDESDESETSDESDGESFQAVAGRLVGTHGLDVHPDAVVALLESDWSEDEILDKFN